MTNCIKALDQMFYSTDLNHTSEEQVSPVHSQQRSLHLVFCLKQNMICTILAKVTDKNIVDVDQ